ncbi:MAG: restriction endonuclease subunit S [Humidesulfovibrio sp.]|nr:restriction endonuclease subunit S [Humidesulfovibrio sp.]
MPESWVLTSLGEFLSARGTTVDPARQPETRFVLYSVPSFETGSPEVVYGKEVGSTKQQVDPGDVLLCKINPRINRSWVVGVHAPPTIASTEWIRFSPSGACQAAYLKLFLNQDCVKIFLAQNVSGVGGSLMRVKPSTVAPYPFPLPPSAEQARIVSRIEELFSDLDKGEENLRRAQAQLKRYRQSVLKAAVTGELTRAWRERNADTLESGEALLKRILKARRAAWEKAELEKLRAKGKRPTDDAWKSRYVEPQGPNTEGLPELPQGWAWTSIGQLFNVFIGSTPSRKESTYWNGGIPWASSGEVAFCRIKATKETVSELGYQNSSIKLHPKGTILIAMIGEGKTRGQVAILDIPACHSQNSAAIRVSETPVPPEYIYHYLASRYDLNRKRGQGGNQPALNKDLVQSIPVPLPPLQELAELVDDLERRLVIADVMAKELAKVATSTGGLRQSILKAAFSGKLVPQDPNDEPAEELLKRIAAERAAQSARPARSAAQRTPSKPSKARAAAQPSASSPAAPSAAVASSSVPGLAAVRKAAGLSQAQLADRAGINQAYVSQMETGKRAITAEQAEALARALGIAPSALTQA